MANWITHTRIADMLISKGLDVDVKGFCIGNVAPDCNIENEDWTAYIPAKEVTHFMNEKGNKTSCDYETFYNEYIKDKVFESKEEFSFLLGYYCHLITDAQYQLFIRNKDRIVASFNRIKSNNVLYRKIKDFPETFDSLKKVFGKWNVFADIIELENEYIKKCPDCSYNLILRNTQEFNDYLDFFPKDAITRKLPIMMNEYDEWSTVKGSGFYFFSIEEYENYIHETVNMIFEKIYIKNIM